MLVNQTRQSINNLAEEVGQATGVIGRNEPSRPGHLRHSLHHPGHRRADQPAGAERAPSKRPARVSKAVVSPWWRTKCGCCRAVPRTPPEIQSTIETLQQTTARAVSLMQTSQGLADNSVKDADAAAAALEEITQAVSLISRHGRSDRHRRRGADQVTGGSPRTPPPSRM